MNKKQENKQPDTREDRVRRSKLLSPGAKLLWIELKRGWSWGRDECWPSRDILAALLAVSERSVSRWAKELEERGLIKIDRRMSGNRYKLVQTIPEDLCDETRLQNREFASQFRLNIESQQTDRGIITDVTRRAVGSQNEDVAQNIKTAPDEISRLTEAQDRTNCPIRGDNLASRMGQFGITQGTIWHIRDAKLASEDDVMKLFKEDVQLKKCAARSGEQHPEHCTHGKTEESEVAIKSSGRENSDMELGQADSLSPGLPSSDLEPPPHESPVTPAPALPSSLAQPPDELDELLEEEIPAKRLPKSADKLREPRTRRSNQTICGVSGVLDAAAQLAKQAAVDPRLYDEAPPSPPQSPQDVLEILRSEIRSKYGFDASRSVPMTPEAATHKIVAKTILEKYPSDVVIKMLRVLVWDWEQVRTFFPPAPGVRTPTLEHLVKYRAILSTSINTGVDYDIAGRGSHNSYAARYLNKTHSPETGNIDWGSMPGME